MIPTMVKKFFICFTSPLPFGALGFAFDLLVVM